MRIVRKKINDLKPYENNAKIHTPEQVQQIARSIQAFGFNDPIAIDENGMVIEGHGRLLALQELGWTEVDCIPLEGLTDEQKRAYIHVHNQLTLSTGFDLELLELELKNIEGLDMGAFGFDLDITLTEGITFDDEDSDDDEEAQRRLFKERIAAGELSEEDEEYQQFLEKFEHKKTTDDCYTPDNIYEAVKAWAVEQYGLKGLRVLRPFYPGGDYQKERYGSDCVVLDNPPFSIISEICEFYQTNGVRFFLFAPHLTLFSTGAGRHKYVACGVPVTYANGATVSTSFITNLGDVKVLVGADLYAVVNEQNKKNLRELRRELPKMQYPAEVLTSTMLGNLARYGVTWQARDIDLSFTRALDAQKEAGKAIYGGGFLLSGKAAAEKAAAEKAASEKAAAAEKPEDAVTVWELSPGEAEIVKTLGKAVPDDGKH